MKPPLLSLDLAKAKPRTLPPVRNWPETQHVFDDPSIHALNAALSTGRPLLLRGEPGTGKSQLARAAADALGWPFLSRVVNARFEPEDLLFRFDAVARLAKAQLLAKSEDLRQQLDADLFLLPEILWWAFNYRTARIQYEKAAPHCGETGTQYDGETGVPFSPEKGVVVLIDEIDKADSEVPNSLLETLSIGGFQKPYGGQTVQAEGVRPLIIITTNEDRELPPAFLRRCWVHQMDLPEDEAKFRAHLMQRVQAHFPKGEVHPGVVQTAITQLRKDREEMKKNDLPVPGQAELLDLLGAVSTLGKTEGEQQSRLKEIQHMAFRKHRNL